MKVELEQGGVGFDAQALPLSPNALAVDAVGAVIDKAEQRQITITLAPFAEVTLGTIAAGRRRCS